jgi:folate-dependent phosphoribosylglycinamide formyltransferase PurN
MEHRGVVITAGFDKSKSAIAIAEQLIRRGMEVKGFIVVSPYSWSRLRKYIKKRGLSFLWEAIPRLLGYNESASDASETRDYFKTFWEERDIPYKSIKRWAAVNETKYCFVKSINSQNAVEYLNELSPQWLIYSGGGIIRNQVIKAMDGRILNAHQGPLPEIRGMNAAEWSILLDEKQETTIHLIDQGIDTGKIITSLPYTIDENDTLKSIRDKAKIKGIKGLVEVASKKDLGGYSLKENSSDYRQCYILSSAMKELLRKKLQHIQKETV